MSIIFNKFIDLFGCLTPHNLFGDPCQTCHHRLFIRCPNANTNKMEKYTFISVCCFLSFKCIRRNGDRNREIIKRKLWKNVLYISWNCGDNSLWIRLNITCVRYVANINKHFQNYSFANEIKTIIKMIFCLSFKCFINSI